MSYTSRMIDETKPSSGGGGGTSDYTELENLPKVNNVTLTGNKTSSQLGLQDSLVSGTNIKTINSTSLLGSGDIEISGGTITDVQKAGVSVVVDGVANFPMANPNDTGICPKLSAGTYAIQKTGSDFLTAVSKTYSEYNSLNTNGFIAKGTLENVITGKALESVSTSFTSGDTVTLAKNQTFVGSTVTSVTVAYPATLDNSFISEVDFTTGTGTITFGVETGTIMKGDDCSNGVFTPLESSTYSIIFAYNGTTKYAIVVKVV